MTTQTRAPGPSFQHAYAALSGARLHYVTVGKGKLLLFLHGFPEFWYAWRKQLLVFGQEYQAVAPDMRGYNLSSKPVDVEQYRMQYLIQDVRELLEHLGHTTCTLIGHDGGGGVAWAFALAHPEYVEKLIIINMAHPAVFEREQRENPAQQEASQYMLLFRSPRGEEVLAENNFARFDEHILQPGLQQGYLTEDDRQAYLTAWAKPGALTGGLNYYRAARVGPPNDTDPGTTGNYTAPFPSVVVQVPTLVIWGEQDRALLPGNLDGLEAFVPQLTLKRIADATHWIVHEQTALVNDALREFLGIRP